MYETIHFSTIKAVRHILTVISKQNPVAEIIAQTLEELEKLDPSENFTLLQKYPELYDPVRLPKVSKKRSLLVAITYFFYFIYL